MATFDAELRAQMNQLFEPAGSAFCRDEIRYPTSSGQSSAGTPDRSLSGSPCSSSVTLCEEVEEEAHKLKDDQLSGALVQETVSSIHSRHIQAMKAEFNPNAAVFIPSSPIIRLLASGRAPSTIGITQTWQDILRFGTQITDRPFRLRLVRQLFDMGPWTFNALCDLAWHFYLAVANKPSIMNLGPEAAIFAVEFRDALRIHDSEWDSSCFVFHLQKYALEHFKPYWCSHDNPWAISLRNKPDVKRWKAALDLSGFIADMFAFDIIKAPTMHECLGILLHEMVSVEHVRAVQTMVKRAGPTLWQTADSHERLQEFTTRFLERTSLLPDNANPD
ncbi:uncharacterized protein EDB91DRAFT_231067 [Suillus paluster]|uniref:uncharacterized protein n=1 Tax=Suillus paluster TaxID=48578 RepID=UPI001B86C270|nr:uncharacterized protein EDB91DRAFT_231067 [Suillus paluster]KAG1743172.1 hypothetical protein EDB91DRAFT_231067 [Suillus paluster]